MSMTVQPAQDMGFLIDHEAAAYILLSTDKKHNIVPEEIVALLDAGTFASRAKSGDLPEDYSLPMIAHECIEDNTCFFSNFDGEVNSMLPEKAVSPIEMSCSEDYILYVPTARGADLFKAAYTGPDELLEEFQSVFKSLGIDFPADFDWWARIVNISGTNCT